MKVMCIAKMEFEAPASGPIPAIGEECIVTGQGSGIGFGDRLYYQLASYPTNIGYDACGFAILPDEDAEEIETAEHEAIVPNPAIQNPMP